MNSITFVVDKLTPPSTPLHPPPSHNNPTSSSSPASSTRPDSGYFSLYASNHEDKDTVVRAEPVLRRRQVGEPPVDEMYGEKVNLIRSANLRSTNVAVRGIKYAFTAITGVLWALLYPFSKVYNALQRFFNPRRIKPSPPSQHQQSMHSEASTLDTSVPFSYTPDITSSDTLPPRPSSSASELSSSGTDSDAETDVSTLASTDISEASSMSSIPPSSLLRRSPRLQSVAEKEELAALTRRRTADSLKSPTSPRTPSITSQSPLTPLPITTPKTAVQLIPRPLIPIKPAQKTLVLDLDETLIHSLAKGGKLGSGHMVEVKFDKHAILYFVHKRPFCDLFLRKVSKWYDCVIFTASVQEYADPVIDWLEAERKIFKARYYRQHCTVENGAYIKDLSVIERDLGRVCILDNSPISYAWHEENAIPIEGWISDPTDNDLLHLIPFLRALRFVGDVRNLLGLRTGARKA